MSRTSSRPMAVKMSSASNGSGIGSAIRNFKSGLSEDRKEIDVTPDETEK